MSHNTHCYYFEYTCQCYKISNMRHLIYLGKQTYVTIMHRLSNQTYVHSMETRPLHVMLISRGILVFVYVQLLMVLRMVYWCTPISIMLQRSISYTLASFSRHCLLYFLSKHMCKLQSKLLAHMQREQLLPFRVHKTCPYPFTHGKYAWASNMDSIKFQFISL